MIAGPACSHAPVGEGCRRWAQQTAGCPAFRKPPWVTAQQKARTPLNGKRPERHGRPPMGSRQSEAAGGGRGGTPKGGHQWRAADCRPRATRCHWKSLQSPRRVWCSLPLARTMRGKAADAQEDVLKMCSDSQTGAAKRRVGDVFALCVKMCSTKQDVFCAGEDAPETCSGVLTMCSRRMPMPGRCVLDKRMHSKGVFWPCDTSERRVLATRHV